MRNTHRWWWPLGAVLATSIVAQDAVVGTSTVATDTRPLYRSGGTLTTTDALNDGVNGPAFATNGVCVPFGAPFWTFSVRHRTNAPHWNAAGALRVQIGIEGVHCHGPHLGDVDPNDLPLAFSPMVNVPFGVAGTKLLAVANRVRHPSGGGVHFDHYGAKAVVTALAGVGGAGNQLTGAYEVIGKHTLKKRRPREFRGFAIGSSWRAGTSVDYDAGLQTLTVVAGPIDIADGQGGATGGVEPRYRGDPVVSGKLSIGRLDLVDPSAFVFSGTQVLLLDPARQFAIEAATNEWSPRSAQDATGPDPAMFDRIAIQDAGPGTAGASAFVHELVDGNLLGHAFSRSERSRLQGMGLSIEPVTDLVAATAGFTRSARVPATVLIAAAIGGDAECYFRNGSGLNPPDYHCVTEPVLGATWLATIDATATTLSTGVLVGFEPLAGVPLFGSELLVALNPPPIFLPGLGSHAIAIPPRERLIGAELFTQGVLLEADGTRVEVSLTNALDLVIGH